MTMMRAYNNSPDDFFSDGAGGEGLILREGVRSVGACMVSRACGLKLRRPL